MVVNPVIGFIFVLLAITSYGIWLGFGPPSIDLEDPFDNHED